MLALLLFPNDTDKVLRQRCENMNSPHCTFFGTINVNLLVLTMDSSTSNLERIMKQIDSLGADEKTKLLKKLLENSTLQINSGSSVFEAKTVFQFNINSEEQIAGILDTIADKLYGKLS